MGKEKIRVTLRVNKEEYENLQQNTKSLVLLPTHAFETELTTGKLGNSNRIMLPNKLLTRHAINSLLKKVPAKFFTLNHEKYLLLKLQEKKRGIPKFKE